MPGLYSVLRPAEPSMSELILAALGGRKDVYFVQVGANDGVRADPLHELIVGNEGWQGIFVEPLETAFERLRDNYEGADRFAFENVAVGPDGQSLSFYFVSPEAAAQLGDDLPWWFDQVGSFDRDHLRKVGGGVLDPFVVDRRVTCVSLPSLLARNHATRVDLLHIDAEGYDCEILAQFDFDAFQPRAVLFEHQHASPTAFAEARSLLRKAGYWILRFEVDTLAVHRSCGIPRLWWTRGLRRYRDWSRAGSP